MRNRMYGGVRGRKTRVGEKLHRFPPTRFVYEFCETDERLPKEQRQTDREGQCS